MSESNNPAEIKAVYLEACKLVEGLLVKDGPQAALDESERQRLTRACLLFSTVIHFNPTHWPSLWLLGKIAHRLGDANQSFEYFRLASNCNPDHADVLRETTIASLEIERLEDAIIYGSRAVEVAPHDAGLRSNLALALLFSERLEEARIAISEAIARDPADRITSQIATVINEVCQGVRPCPHHVRDLTKM